MSLTTTATLHNGVQIPRLGLGVYKMEDGTDVYHAVLSALEIGYRHIDTASFYQNEEGVGRAIRDSGIPREEIFVTTKVWNDEQGYENTKKAFQASLERLGLDYVDLYLVHWPVPGKYKETYKALEEFYKAKKARAIGVSNFLPHHLEDLLTDVEIKPMANQIELHPQLTQTETREFCKKHDIIVEAWSPLAKARYLDDPVLQSLAEKYNKTAAQIIIRWEYQSDIVTIPKSVKPTRQKENADIFDFELTEEDMKKVDGLNQDKRTGPHPDEFNY
ncbi:aldo/keto reductase [Aquibacillus sp. 3ASR75-54]|uniref:Aldo/keto reductase n=2 Tax=Aquibacillus salsiterrae TaxID=2950439 RepID=A0A9X3WD60_9BACI|nr:aldo/keto reductase [Aquibacillus salsiterrae]MDC3417680.1 aldo/keto reductase [Aquibacillus salsiterrae]